MAKPEEDNSYTNRLAALKLIRENIYSDKPKQYGWLDVAEDLPESARAVAPIFKEVLPSLGLISKDPKERAEQIQKAIDRIKSTTKSDKPILSESLRSAGQSALGAAIPSTLISALIHSLGFRGLTKKLPNGKTKFQIPVDPKSRLKEIFASPDSKKETLKHILGEAGMSTTMAAIHGASVPFASHSYHISDKSLEDARKIMQEHPYLTSLPTSELMSVLREDKNQDSPTVKKLKDVAKGTGIGLAYGAKLGLIPSILSAVGKFSGNALSNTGSKLYSKLGPGMLQNAAKKIKLDSLTSGRLRRGVADAFTENLKRDVRNAALWGGGAGAISGALTKQLPADDEEAQRTNKA